MTTPGLYLHIPFCLRKCPYCDFYSCTFEADLADHYVQALCDVMGSGHFAAAQKMDTVYFGGGTPSVLGPKRLEKLLWAAQKAFGLTDNAEITLEANPATVTKADFADLRQAGFNRLSVGVQSGVDEELAQLGRLHTADQAAQAIEDAAAAGFDNISGDLMLAILGQTMDSMEKSINFLTSLPISHVSAYLLKVEEGTEYHRRGVVPDEDVCADMYLVSGQLLEERGFAQYEISSFARPGRESRHNTKYWRLAPYLGLGPGAHSFWQGQRFAFGADLKGFIENPLAMIEQDGPGGGFDEAVMLGLRLRKGLNRQELEQEYPAQTAEILKKIRPFAEKGLMNITPERIFLANREAFLLSNSIIGAILP